MSRIREILPYVEDEFGNAAIVLSDNIFRGGLVTVASSHHEIHCGDKYEGTDTGDLSNGAVIEYAIIVPNEGLTETEEGAQQSVKQYHAKIAVDTEAEALIEFFEGATLTANGTALSQINQNRNSSRTDYLGFYLAPTVSSYGTQLPLDVRIGSGRAVGGSLQREDEMILKDNTVYIVRITNAVTTNNYYNIKLDHYVHPGA